MVTIEDIKRLIDEETAKLNKIGYKPIRYRELKLVNATSFYADAYKGPDRIRVSKYYLAAPIEEIRGTIMHELIHMIPEAGHGHGAAWKKIANEVNDFYPQYQITRCGTQLKGGTSFSLKRESMKSAACSAKPVRVYKLKCEKCSCVWTRYRQSNLTMYPESYHCKCGGKIIKLN